MSIKGIDAQIMITRLPDTQRDASVMQKRPEVMQDFLAAQGKVNDAHDQNKVSATLESEMEQIRSDVDGGSGSDYEGDGGSGSGGKKEEDQDFLVPPGNNVIDIII